MLQDLLQSNTSHAQSFSQWREEAARKDLASGAQSWVHKEESNLYDYRVIRRRLNELRQVRASGDVDELVFYLHEGIHGNMAGMGSPALYQRTQLGGTKQLITDFINETVDALDQVLHAEDDEVPMQEKLAFFNRCADCFGRSALMLSGAGSLGPFHIGVVKAMAEQGILPTLISGSSAGSIVTAIVGTRTEEELAEGGFWDSLVDDMTAMGEDSKDGRLAQQDLLKLLRRVVPDVTFEQALAKTGRHINISVAPTKINQRSRLLNAIQSPSACLHEAVLASCAVPGVFPPVTLAAKTRNGERKPYVVSRKWVDGSITDDLPAERLSRLYGANHFIGSQANPAVLWALQDPNSTNLFAQLANVYQSAVRDWSKTVYPFAMNAVRDVYPMNILTRMWFGFLTQEYNADVNITLPQRFFNPTKLLSPISKDEARQLIEDGERATWPKIEMIRSCSTISRKIDEALRELNEELGHFKPV